MKTVVGQQEEQPRPLKLTRARIRKARRELLEDRASPTVKSRFPTRALFALGVALVFLGVCISGIRAGQRAYSPAQLALFRYLIASAVLAVYACFAHFRRPGLRELPGLVIA